MAVPKRPNEFDEDGEDGDVVERIFDEEDDQEEDGGWIAETDIPFHLLALARAAESGDLDAFRNALGNIRIRPHVFLLKTCSFFVMSKF